MHRTGTSAVIFFHLYYFLKVVLDSASTEATAPNSNCCSVSRNCGTFARYEVAGRSLQKAASCSASVFIYAGDTRLSADAIEAFYLSDRKDGGQHQFFAHGWKSAQTFEGTYYHSSEVDDTHFLAAGVALFCFGFFYISKPCTPHGIAQQGSLL